jgi:hypothetical protein
MTAKTHLFTLLFDEGRREWISPLLFVCVIAGIELGLTTMWREAGLPQAYEILREYPTAEERPIPDVVIFGESVTQGGILEPDFKEHLGSEDLRVTNLALASSSVPFAYFQLRNLENQGQLPDAIIMGYLVRSYMVNHGYKFLSRAANWQEFRLAAGMGVDFETLVAGLVGKVFYSVRYRQEIALLALDFNPGFLRFPRLESSWTEQRQAWLSERHQHAEVWQGLDRIELEDVHDSFLLPFDPPEFTRRSLKRFLEITRNHEIAVYLVVPPVPEALHRHRQEINFEPGLRSYFEQLRQQYPHLHLVDITAPVYPSELYQDASHLTLPGGERFTRETAEKLREPMRHDFPERFAD